MSVAIAMALMLPLRAPCDRHVKSQSAGNQVRDTEQDRWNRIQLGHHRLPTGNGYLRVLRNFTFLYEQPLSLPRRARSSPSSKKQTAPKQMGKGQRSRRVH